MLQVVGLVVVVVVVAYIVTSNFNKTTNIIYKKTASNLFNVV